MHTLGCGVAVLFLMGPHTELFDGIGTRGSVCLLLVDQFVGYHQLDTNTYWMNMKALFLYGVKPLFISHSVC